MAGSQDGEPGEAATSNEMTECKDQVECNEDPGSPPVEIKVSSKEGEGEEVKETEGLTSPQRGTSGPPSSIANQSPSTTVGPNTPGQQSITPQQVPIQPYASYPPTYYYPNYGAPLPSPSAHHLMTGTTNPYQYTDVSHCSDPIPDNRRNRGGVTEPFPSKLHRMLEAVEREGLGEVVSFFSHGRAFAIHKPRRFVMEIMPRFFRQTRLTSFQRQLNLYGFRRISQGPDNGGYYHELFLRGRGGLCVNMKRTKVKGDSKMKRDPDSEPNFYSYPPIQPEGSVPVQQYPYPPIQPEGSVPVQQTLPLSPPASGASPGRPATLYPGYGYPPPQHYPYPNAPYTAAQQNAPAYPPPPPGYFAYPWYPPPPQPGVMPTSQMTPHASPMKGGEEAKTPDGDGMLASCDTPGSIDSANLTSVKV